MKNSMTMNGFALIFFFFSLYTQVFTGMFDTYTIYIINAYIIYKYIYIFLIYIYYIYFIYIYIYAVE